MKFKSKITRRRLIEIGGTGIIAASLPGLLTSCGGVVRKDLDSEDNHLKNRTGLPEDIFEIIKYASLAPSGHNMQPWSVTIKSSLEFIIGSDKKRWLPAVDPDNREAMLSIGAFIENLTSAAAAFGYESTFRVTANNSFDSDLVSIKLNKAKTDGFDLNKISRRRTVKKGYLPDELKSDDVKKISMISPGQIFYFPRSSEHAKCLKDWTIESYSHQTWRDDAQRELAGCIRFNKKDTGKFRYGLTTEGMEIQGIAGWYVRNFMNNEDAMAKSFREQGIDIYSKNAGEGAGWIIITGKSSGVAGLIETGRIFQRLALSVREMNIALHPMTQILEEKKWRDQMTAMHRPGMIPQFILRVGYLNSYPEPVSVRRPVDWFIKQM